MLKTLGYRYYPDLQYWFHEVRCNVSQQRTMVGLRMRKYTAAWFETYFMPEVSQTQARRFGMDGTLLSLMTEPIGNESAELFSAVVYGLGCACVSIHNLGRMEMLALELVTEAQKMLQMRREDANDKFWRIIEQKFNKHRTEIDISVAFAPHKMRKLGDDLETSAAGAGERADVLLLAWPYDQDDASVLGWAYHTTNVPAGTASMRRTQAYPESRILWRQCVPLPELMKLAAKSLALRLHLPHPCSVQGLLDPAEWDAQVLTPESDSADVLETSDANTDDSDTDAGL